jgi:hypothetical protein
MFQNRRCHGYDQLGKTNGERLATRTGLGGLEMQVGLFKIRKVPSLLFDSFFPVDCGIGCAIGSCFFPHPATSSLELLQVEEEQEEATGRGFCALRGRQPH